MSKSIKITVLGILSCLLIFGCKQDVQSPSRDSMNIYLPKDPLSLNPAYRMTSLGREVHQYIHLPLGDFHPETLTIYPILLENLPRAKKDESGVTYYDVELKKDATWADGQKMTADDYAFTIKSLSLPQAKPKAMRSTLANINKLVLNENNPQNLRVYINDDYMLAKEVVSTMYLLPKHVYKNNTVLDELSMEQIKNLDDVSSITGFDEFINDFNDIKHYTTNIIGSGPYKLDSWETNQSLSISKVENYWGEKYKDNPFLQSNVERMNFKIIADEMTAITALKDGALDVVKGLPAINFNTLKEEMPEASFLNSPSSRYYYIAINNKNPLLKDASTRKAIAKLVDVEGMLENIEFGYGKILTGPINPDLEAYNEKLSTEIYNVDEAKSLLKMNGWADSNNNKIVDKIINGKREELELDILINGGPLGQKVAILLQEEANKAGIKINIVTKDMRRMRGENIANYNYDLAAMAEGQDIMPLDPYRRWHSDNIEEGGSNYAGFQTAKSDSLITLIRNEKDEDERVKLFESFHTEIYEQQPVIFLFSPAEKIILSEDFTGKATAKRPGYLANTFKIKPAQK